MISQFLAQRKGQPPPQDDEEVEYVEMDPVPPASDSNIRHKQVMCSKLRKQTK